MEHGHAGGNLFMLRLETAARVAKFEAATPSRFVPITLPGVRAS
jgi:hypothetical protein